MVVRSTAFFAVIAVLGRDALEPRLSVLVEDSSLIMRELHARLSFY